MFLPFIGLVRHLLNCHQHSIKRPSFPRVARSPKIKRPNLAISSLKKPNSQMVKKAKLSKKIYQNISNKFWKIIICWMFCWNLAKIGQKRYYYLHDRKKAKKRPNGQIILFLENCFKKGQMATLPFPSSHQIWPFYLHSFKRQSIIAVRFDLIKRYCPKFWKGQNALKLTFVIIFMIYN